MDGLQQVGLPVLGIVAAAAVTFYVVSFSELREKSLNKEWDDDSENGGFRTSLSSRERRSRRKAQKQSNKP
ncbi:uncharacterized protein LOC112521951 [Cynara cardunculus var. scolymus]|uniref:Transmembrane protein n=1 Tax=Cynara cardunculus var. scolymus TaxID=59895 RepID=A0A118JTA4_CYNCS|nr:uncharacterized protein LOC112521951 [Cynara cardunculus var. scolymus]KVH90652.1 hypothetical protein Ccrd_007284 [Cynara cardunculus var. scolymus]